MGRWREGLFILGEICCCLATKRKSLHPLASSIKDKAYRLKVLDRQISLGYLKCYWTLCLSWTSKVIMNVHTCQYRKFLELGDKFECQILCGSE